MMGGVSLYAALMQPVLDNISVVGYSAGLWFSLQLIIDFVVPAVFPKWHAEIVAASKKEDWQSLRSRVIGTIFSVYASCLAAYFLLFDPPNPHNFYEPHPLVSLAVASSVSWQPHAAAIQPRHLLHRRCKRGLWRLP